MSEEISREEDVIVRTDVLDAIGSWIDSGESCFRGDAYACLYERIKKLPKAELKARTARWVYAPFNPEDAICSKCLYVVNTTKNNIEDYNFCPLCGRRMENKEQA